MWMQIEHGSRHSPRGGQAGVGVGPAVASAAGAALQAHSLGKLV